MLLDLIATDNYANFNIQLAQILGLHESIYLAELINISKKAEEKNKLIDGFVNVDRKYITSRTTLSATEQKDIDRRLSKINILKLGSKDMYIQLDLNVITALLTSTDEKAVVDISQIAKKKPDKRNSIFNNLVSKINTDNTELQRAYQGWISSVLQKQGWMSAKSINIGEAVVDEYANGNLDLALKIIELADTNAYRDMQWAINLYESKYKHQFEQQYRNNSDSSRSVELSSEVF